MARLDGKVAVVTGGARGIGRASCMRLAEAGARVAVTDMRDAEGQAVVDAIAAEGGTAMYRHLDVTSEDDVRQAMADVAHRFESIDVLVNNAGVGGPLQPTHEIALADWNALMAINVTGVFLCTKHAIPYMQKAGGGSIINLSSIYGLVGAGDAPAYHASKGAVRLMSKNDALIYAAQGIRVNSVHPGFIWTPLVEDFLSKAPDPAAARRALDAKHPLGRIGDADDVAWGIVYLASDESRFVTGSELVIDGGYTAQ
jgi:NAD(P)-dependent dehydrogenase (short-subunit alcohol dehydrogenase family)